MLFKAEHFTLVSGTGQGATPLNAFDRALQTAGVGNYNLVRVSSILPPMAQEAKKIEVEFGSLLPIAYGEIRTGEAGRELTAAVGVGIPKNREDIGVIMEYSEYENGKLAQKKIKDMVEEAMWNRKIQIEKILYAVSSCTAGDGFWCAFAGISLW